MAKMTDTNAAVDPEPAVEAAARQLQELTLHMQLGAQEAHFAAVERNPEDLVAAAERLLTMHVEFARLYRTWLAAHRTPILGRRLPPAPPCGSMSI